jgi:peptidyl-prolyl cis-trans isomerase C
MPSACQSGGCGGAAPPPIPPPLSFGEVRVDGIEIPPEAIAREIQHHPAPDPERAWTAAAQALAIRTLLLNEARRLGVAGAPESDALGRVETDEDAAIAALLDREVVPAEPDESECRRYFEARRDRFRAPELFEVGHVLIEPRGDDEAAWGAAQAEARVIAGDVGDDPVAFARAAKAFSACPSAQQDGSLGQIRRGDLVPEIQAAVEALTPGVTGREPVRSRFGWHVLRLARRIEGHALPFDAVRERIAEMLAARAWSVAASRYVAALAERAEIEGVHIAPAADPAAL